MRGVEVIAERPDGTRIPFGSLPSLITDDRGRITGAIDLLIDLTEREQEALASQRLAAIVSSSDDAIISKTLEGRVTSWNGGATRIFGFSAEEMIGQLILRIIPPELHHEESEILAKLRRGERIEHFDTIRLTRDGQRIDISLTVSPLHDGSGNVIGASKVARDISERKRDEELRQLLFFELNHRVKNTLATIQAIASQSLRNASSPADFVRSFSGRVQALARAHDVLVKGEMKGAAIGDLIREQVALGGQDSDRFTVSGPPVMLEPGVTVQLALVLHELATNARKYGALSVPEGLLTIRWTLQRRCGGRTLLLEWRESGVPEIPVPQSPGFGSRLIENSLQSVGGDARLHYGADGLHCSIELPLQDVGTQVGGVPFVDADDVQTEVPEGYRKVEMGNTRVLVVEDEALVAMDMEACLEDAGCTVIGPAATLDEAKRLAAEGSFDIALIDANLGGHRVDEVAAILTRRNIPFAFSTGYRRETLPAAFGHAPILAKPFSGDEIIGMLCSLLNATDDAPPVISLPGGSKL